MDGVTLVRKHLWFFFFPLTNFLCFPGIFFILVFVVFCWLWFFSTLISSSCFGWVQLKAGWLLRAELWLLGWVFCLCFSFVVDFFLTCSLGVCFRQVYLTYLNIWYPKYLLAKGYMNYKAMHLQTVCPSPRWIPGFSYRFNYSSYIAPGFEGKFLLRSVCHANELGRVGTKLCGKVCAFFLALWVFLIDRGDFMGVWVQCGFVSSVL